MNVNKFLLAPEDCVMLFIDHQPTEYFGITSHPPQTIRNNVVGMAKATIAFNVPFVLTSIAQTSFNGLIIEELSEALKNTSPIDRTTINSWEDTRVVEKIKESKRKKLLISGLWTEVCATLTALSAKAEGYDVYIITDTCGGISPEAHERAIQRMIQAGVIPVTWLGVMLEWQRDWSRKSTSAAVLEIAKEHSAPYGISIKNNQDIANHIVNPKN